MCRTGGRRCPSSRTTASGGSRGANKRGPGTQAKETAPASSTSPPDEGGNTRNTGDTSTTPQAGGFSYTDPPGGAMFYNAPGAIVGMQAGDVTISGGMTITSDGIVIGGPITTTSPDDGDGWDFTPLPRDGFSYADATGPLTPAQVSAAEARLRAERATEDGRAAMEARRRKTTGNTAVRNSATGGYQFIQAQNLSAGRDDRPAPGGPRGDTPANSPRSGTPAASSTGNVIRHDGDGMQVNVGGETYRFGHGTGPGPQVNADTVSGGIGGANADAGRDAARTARETDRAARESARADREAARADRSEAGGAPDGGHATGERTYYNTGGGEQIITGSVQSIHFNAADGSSTITFPDGTSRTSRPRGRDKD